MTGGDHVGIQRVIKREERRVGRKRNEGRKRRIDSGDSDKE